MVFSKWDLVLIIILENSSNTTLVLLNLSSQHPQSFQALTAEIQAMVQFKFETSDLLIDRDLGIDFHKAANKKHETCVG